jgi:hypothetical protein
MVSDTQTGWRPSALEPGPELKALAPFLVDVTWTGRVHANGMGPGSPEMSATGRSRGTWIVDGLWLAVDMEQDQFVADERVLTWKAHMVIGWSDPAKEYRATVVDSNGNASVCRGRIEGDRFTLETMGEDAFRVRFVWDVADPGALIWFSDYSVSGGPWTRIEEYVMTPIARAGQGPRPMEA